MRMKRLFARGVDDRPTLQLTSTSVMTIVAVVAGVAALLQSTPGLFCSSARRVSGVEIQHGASLVIVAGILALIIGVVVRNRPRLFAALLFSEVAVLVTGVVLVAFDSGLSKDVESCGLFETTTSLSTADVSYLFVIWPLAALAILFQACRGRRITLLRLIRAASLPVVIGAGVGLLSGFGGKERAHASATRARIPRGVLICRNPFQAPQVFGGWQCDDTRDIGTAPIPRPKSLMCSTDLSRVKGKVVRIQAWYFRMLLKHTRARSSDSTTNAFVTIDGSDVDNPDARLPDGTYHCRFFVAGKLVRSRSFQIGPTHFRLAENAKRFRYSLAIETLKSRPRPNRPTRVGDEFDVLISSPNLPLRIASPVNLCVNGRDGESCYSGYVLHGETTRIDWQVAKREGVANLYRLTVEAGDRTLATRDLRLERR